MAEELEPGTWMIHYACDACSMTATAVLNHASTRAWQDHQESHETYASYRRWTWKVLELPL